MEEVETPLLQFYGLLIFDLCLTQPDEDKNFKSAQEGVYEEAT